MRKSTLIEEGKFYKGNLHTHTSISDGTKKPEEVVALYKENGYDFLAITDHDIYGVHEELNEEEFIVLPGIEMASTYDWKEPLWAVHHLLGIGDPDKNTYPHGYAFNREEMLKMSPQAIIDELKAHGNMVIYNHPHWSKANMGEITQLRGLNGMEIYNHNCQIESRSGNGEVFYDHFLWTNNHIWCYGTDDAHMRLNDYGGGYITVKAPALTHRAIFDALVSGSFYASAADVGKMAPKIRDFYVEDGIARIDCSPSSRIYFMTSNHYSLTEDLSQCNLTQGSYEMPAEAVFVRAVCVDQYGYTSWTQPILIP